MLDDSIPAMTWAGTIEDEPPEPMDCAIHTTPVGKPVIEGLKNLTPGGRLIINATRKEEIDKEILLNLYSPHPLWLEKEIKSVANVARSDVSEFLELAGEIPIPSEIQVFRLEEANQPLMELKNIKIRGGKVLKIES